MVNYISHFVGCHVVYGYLQSFRTPTTHVNFIFLITSFLGPELTEKRGSQHCLCNGVYFSCLSKMR